MTNDQRKSRRKLRIFQHAERVGTVSKTCRTFGLGRASFTKWRHAFRDWGAVSVIKMNGRIRLRQTKRRAQIGIKQTPRLAARLR